MVKTVTMGSLQINAWGRSNGSKPVRKAQAPKPNPQVGLMPAVHRDHLSDAQADAMLQRAQTVAKHVWPESSVPVEYVGLEKFVSTYGAMRSPLQTAGDYLAAQKK